MGYKTKVQHIARKGSEQFYATLPSALAHALEIQKGEPVEWIVADKANIILSRPAAPPNPVEVEKKTKRPCGTRSTGCSNSATRPGGCART